MNVFVTAEPLTYRARIASTDPATGMPILMWVCDHSHTEYIEAVNCGNDHLRTAMQVIGTPPPPAP